MDQNLLARLLEWRETVEGSLRKRWYLWPILLVADLVWDRFLKSTNEYLDKQAGSMSNFSKVAIGYLPNTITLAILLSLAIVVGLIIHAYFETRGQPPLPGLSRLKIHSAFYGSGPHTDKPVVNEIERRIVGDRFSELVGPEIFGDPDEGFPKRIVVEYSMDGGPIIKTERPLSRRLTIPEDPWLLEQIHGARSKLKIHWAFYGTSSANDLNVTDYLQNYPREGLSLWVDNKIAPRDPDVGPAKRLRVQYSFGNQELKTVERPENSHLVLPEDSSLQQIQPPAALEYVTWHGGGSGRLPINWPDATSTPSWISIKNGQITPSKTAERVTARLEFVNSEKTRLLVVPEAVWFEQTKMARTGMVERWAHEANIDGGDDQSFVFFSQNGNGDILPYKNGTEPLGILDYDAWTIRLTVTSDNLAGFVGLIRFTRTRNNLAPAQPAFTMLRVLPSRLESIRQSPEWTTREN